MPTWAGSGRMTRSWGVGWSGFRRWVRRGCRGGLPRTNAIHKALLLPNRIMALASRPGLCNPPRVVGRGRVMGASGSGEALPARRLGRADAAGVGMFWPGEGLLEHVLGNIGERLPARRLIERNAHAFERRSVIGNRSLRGMSFRWPPAFRLLALPVKLGPALRAQPDLAGVALSI